MTPLVIREATESDAQRIAEIYNPYVLTTTATFDTEPKTVEDRAEWLRARSSRHPVFVAEADDDIVAWASLSPYRERPAYANTVEAGVYVDEGHRGRGIGGLMTSKLLEAARALGHHVVIAQIVADNEASLRMVERLGFRRVGMLPEVGRKFDRWLDVAVMQYTIDSAPAQRP